MAPILLLATSVASAIQLRAYSPEAQFAEADLVFEGAVVDAVPRYRRDEEGQVVWVSTLFTVEIHKSYWGTVESGRVNLVLPGGAWPDGSVTEVAGAPWVYVGDQLIVHGLINDEATVRAHNWSGGLLKVTQGDRVVDGRGQSVMAFRQGESVSFLPSGHEAQVLDVAASEAEPIPEVSSPTLPVDVGEVRAELAEISRRRAEQDSPPFPRIEGVGGGQ